jgi:hypothetical protein
MPSAKLEAEWIATPFSWSWFAAGRPKAKSPVLGSYEGWSTILGGVLEHAGVAGFLGNLGSLYQFADEEAAHWEEFLDTLAGQYGSKPFTTGELVSGLEGDPTLVATLPEELADDWSKRHTGGSFARRLGKALSRREGRCFGPEEIRIEKAGEARNVQKWRMVSKSLPVNAANAVKVYRHQEAMEFTPA